MQIALVVFIIAACIFGYFAYEKGLYYYAKAQTYDLTKLNDLNVTSTFYDVNGEERALGERAIKRGCPRERGVSRHSEIERHEDARRRVHSRASASGAAPIAPRSAARAITKS